MPQALIAKEEEEKESRRGAPINEVRIEQVRIFLSEAEGSKFDSLPHDVQKAIAAAGAKYGAEKAEGVVEALFAAPEVKSSGRKKDKAEKAMDGLKELVSQPKISEEIREVSHFAWSYYNKELGREQVIESQAETMRNEFESDFDEAKKKGGRGEDDERPMALKVGHRGKAQVAADEELTLSQENLIVQQERKEEKERVASELRGITPQKKPKRARYETEAANTAPRTAKDAEAPDADADSKLAEEARKKLAEAAADEKLAPILEFVVVKGKEKGLDAMMREEDAKKLDEDLLEIDEKKLEVARFQLERQIGRTKGQISILEKMKADGDEKKGKEKKLRLLRKKLAFWNKAHGAMRRLAGGMFGGMAKMLGGIFR